MMPFESIFLIYLVSAICFILGLRGLSSPQTARRGNFLSMSGMALCLITTLIVAPGRNDVGILSALILAAVIGIYTAWRIKLTALPQMIALLNGAGGLSSLLVGTAQILRHQAHTFDTSVGIITGAVVFSGSLIAFLKIGGWYRLKRSNFSNILNILIAAALIFYWVRFSIDDSVTTACLMIASALILGITLTLPIGGADMPIVISLLNAASGFAAAGIGFSLTNILLIITGALVGAGGMILAFVMCKAMNKNIFKIFFASQTPAQSVADNSRQARTASISDVAFLLQNAQKVIIVPGFGMAAANAQYALFNLSSVLQKKYGVEVKFAIHPVAGRMPGHMNVLLIEAKVDYQQVFSMEEINPDFETADVAYVIGANDITNPAAQTDPSSSLFGMPILEVYKAKTVVFVKRSLAAGYSGADNPLFFTQNTLMLYGDAKQITEEIIADLGTK